MKRNVMLADNLTMREHVQRKKEQALRQMPVELQVSH